MIVLASYKKKIIYSYLTILFFLSGCASHSTSNNSEAITSVQIIDRNGFAETISVKSRLANLEHINFLEPQPYKKVMRVFGKAKKGNPTAKITSYHPNGQLWQYLEVQNGRAYGNYQEWHSNGKLKLSCFVIEGLADVAEKSQLSWVFEGKSSAYDEEGSLLAEIFYDKGALEGSSYYYYPDKTVAKIIPYHFNKVEGDLLIFDASGAILERIPFRSNLRHGNAEGFWSPGTHKYQEEYDQDFLNSALYYTREGSLIAEIKNGEGTQALFEDDQLYSLTEFHDGIPNGKVEIFDKDGWITNVYHIHEGKKQGEEWEYYSRTKQPKLYLNWSEDKIQGMAKTWYLNGVLQSEREIHGNKKHGLAFAWYEEGQLMLIEEYDNDILMKGSYYKKGDKIPISKIENGQGIATLYDNKGHFLRKTSYERGKPILE